MAPRFKRNLFWIWKSKENIIALIGFAYSRRNPNIILDFRDKVSNEFISDSSLVCQKTEGEPTPLDSKISFFNKSDELAVQEFFSKKRPGFIASLLKTKKYKEYCDQFRMISDLVKVDIETSHDYPCLIVSSSIHSEPDLLSRIYKVAESLSLDVAKGSELEKIEDIVMSNRNFS